MKYYKLLIGILCLTPALGFGQFIKIYDTDKSLRGFDIVQNDGKTYYSCGSEEGHVIFEIDPITGGIIDYSTHPGNYSSSRSYNSVGKNSLIVSDAGTATQSDNLLVLSGLFGHTSNYSGGTTGILTYNKTKDVGPNFQTSVSREFLPIGFGNKNEQFHSVSDHLELDIVENNTETRWQYLTGTRMNPYAQPTDRYVVPFVMRTDAGDDSPSGSEFIYIPPSFQHETVPTKIVPGLGEQTFVSYGSYLSTSGGYIDNSVQRDAGIIAINNDFSVNFNKTYHNGQLDQNLGAAQAVIQISSAGGQNLLFVSSGNNPMDPNQNQFGDWENDYFHIVRLHNNGAVDIAKKIRLMDPTTSEYLSDVQVADVFNNAGDMYVAGSAKVYTDQVNYSSMAFIVRLDWNLNPTDAVIYELFHETAYDVVDPHINKISIKGSNVFVTGTIQKKSTPNESYPILIRVGLDLEAECSQLVNTTVTNASIFSQNGPELTSSPTLQTGNFFAITPEPVSFQNICPDVSCVEPDILIGDACISTGLGDICISHQYNYSVQFFQGSTLQYSGTGMGMVGTCFGSFFPITPGTYTILIHDEYGCQFSWVENVGVDMGCKKGGNNMENFESADISIFPNPTTGLINIQFTEETSGMISVRDVQGRIVSSKQVFESTTAQLDLSTMDAGVYTIQIGTGSDVQTHRIIKSN